jgi:hypothetical protein
MSLLILFSLTVSQHLAVEFQRFGTVPAVFLDGGWYLKAL